MQINKIWAFPYGIEQKLYDSMGWMKLWIWDEILRHVEIVLIFIGVADNRYIGSVFNRFWRTVFSIFSQHSAKFSLEFSKFQVNKNFNSWHEFHLKAFW